MEKNQGNFKCQICGNIVSEEELYDWNNKKICEDCYIEKNTTPVKICDPWAVYSAKKMLKTTSAKKEQILTDIQKNIYQTIKSKGKITVNDLSRQIGISENELQTQIAVLRHLELVKARKEKDIIYIVPF